MYNRDVQFPNRFKMVKVPGTDDIFEVTPAPGNVYTEGTFWNKGNVLRDATAALYGKGAEAVPDDIFAKIPSMIQSVQEVAEGRARIETGHYEGTDAYGAKDETKTKTLNFTISPKIVLIVEFNSGSIAGRPSTISLAIFVKPATKAIIFDVNQLGSHYIEGAPTMCTEEVTWLENGVSWKYTTQQYVNSYFWGLWSLNRFNSSYDYIAIG